MIIPEAHRYYERDEYVPALTSDYFFYVRLHEEKRMEYHTKMQKNYSDTICRQMLFEEPYWHEGYCMLFDSLYKQKLYQEALACCQQAFAFGYCFEELFDRCLQCHEKIDSKNEFKKYAALHEEKKHKRMEEYKGNQARLKFLVDEEWRRKLYLTRKLPIFNTE